MSAFDTSIFLDQTTQEASVKRPPIAVGEYTAVIGEPDIRPWVSTKDASKSGVACDYAVDVFVPEEERARVGLNTNSLKLKIGLMLDVMPDGKSLDWSPGKNSGVRRLREALDLNKKGEPFNLRMPQGRTLVVKVGHREYPEGSGDLFEDIVGFRKA